MGSAVNTAVAEYFAQQDPPVVFAGHILVASFVDTPTLVSTYSIAGTIPLLGPLARFPTLFNYLRTFIGDKWSNKNQILNYILVNEARKTKYRLTFLAAKDDWDIPWTHTSNLFLHAVNATTQDEITYERRGDFQAAKQTALGAGGTAFEWHTEVGIIRGQILNFGLHDVIMGNPVITMAVMRIFSEDS